MTTNEFLRNYRRQLPEEGSIWLTDEQVALCIAIQRDNELTDAEFAAAATCMEDQCPTS